MKVDVVTFKQLFQQEVQYVIPEFQREYVWTLEDQWEALWGDVQDTAEKYLAQLRKTEDDEAQAQQSVQRHFMGAVVLQQVPGAIADTQKCSVIDGQQRLMTIQLLLNAAKTVFQSLNAPQANKLGQLVNNSYGEEQDKYKLWPAKGDRDTFQRVMTSIPLGAYDSNSQVAKAHTYFRDELEKWVKDSSHIEQRDKIHALETTLLGLFEIVTIDLMSTDDPHVIFEVLNARGTPLSASDLVFNFILHTAKLENNGENLYETFVRPLKSDWWGMEVRQGALVRTQLEIFLNYWLASVAADDVKSHEVYTRFVKYAKAQRQQCAAPISEIAEKIQHGSKIYRSWYLYEPTSEKGKFFERGRRCGLGGMSPLVLWLFSQPELIVSRDDLRHILNDIESFLVRRALCRYITAGLNRLSVTLLKKIHEVSAKDIAPTLISELARGHGAASWPDDDELRHSLLSQPLYGRVGIPKIRIVLAAVEEFHRNKDPYSQATPLKIEDLTIEHLMPQSWQDNWPLDSTADGAALLYRQKLVDSIGNLTLLTAKLNSHISNAAWPKKRAALQEHPGLCINLDLASRDSWSEAEIETRGESLLQDILQIWPRPVSEVT